MSARVPSVGIAILNWNGKHFLQSLLPLLQQINYSNYTVYVIDNNSSDESVTLLKNEFPAVKIVQLDDNYGFAAGYNKGLAALHEDYYLMLNSDVEVEKDFLQPLVSLMEADRQIAVCQPKILSLRDRTFFEHAGAAGGMIDILGYPFCRGRIFDRIEADTGQYNDVRQIFWATGTCSLIRKDAYLLIGGMYAYYFMHMEEIDLCWRLNSAGYKIMYCPQAVIYHLGGGSLSYQSPVKTYYNFRNNIIMCFRNSPFYINCWLLPLRFFLDVTAAVQLVLQNKRANAKAIIKAYGSFFAWILKKEEPQRIRKRSLFYLPGVLKKSIVWQFFVRKQQKFTDIVTNK